MIDPKEDPEFRGGLAQLGLQRAVWARTWEIIETPGLTHGGRLIGIDELDRLGDDLVNRIYNATGAVIVKFLPADKEADFRARFAAPERRFTAWDVFVGGGDAQAASAAYVHGFKLPEGWQLSCLETDAPAEMIAEIQTVQEVSGVAPVPGYYQRGRAVPAVSVLLSDAADAIVATAQAQQRHHADGRWSGYIFAGMVAVHPDHRRKGLGTLINAYLIEQAFAQLNCAAVYEHARLDNQPSRGMIEASGLKLDPRYRCVMFHDANRFGEEFTK